MSRVGKAEIAIPKGVTVELEGAAVRIKGPKGQLSQLVPDGITVRQQDGKLLVQRRGDERRERELHGLIRSLLANAVHGVTEGFVRELEITGIGYKAAVSGRNLTLNLGFSHPIEFPLPDGIEVAVEKQTQLTVRGADKALVGEVASSLRRLRKPDPYKGKGVRFKGETIKLKVGKSGATAGGAG
ncbi:MAG TPA: 50S ribosomal protein L6 [Acidobacteriota bacterium]|jgi:large subunit ribosomal protein L6